MHDSSSDAPGCLLAVLRWFRGSSPARRADVFAPSVPDATKPSTTAPSFPYAVRDSFLSPAELAFYHILQRVVDKRAVICLKVRLVDIFYVRRPHEHQAALNRILQKHLDFLLCDPHSLQPRCGIELDDASHQRPDRQARDAFVDETFRAANLPLIHIRAQRTYDPAALMTQIDPYITSVQASPSATNDTFLAATPAIPSPPLCPRCGIPMLMRTGTKGAYVGRQFYGCANYPHCREMLALA